MLLFSGHSGVHGVYGANVVDQGDGKLKGKAKTVKEEVTTDLWIRHITGEVGLGIVPINEDCKVRFSAIDIDEYPLDLVKLNAEIRRLELPLVLCRTKSGGAHLYLFLETFCEAAEVQQRTRELAALLGYGNAEIFPKQTKILEERGDTGSWINMPYFNHIDTVRYALGETDTPLNLPQFIKYAISKITTLEKLRSAKTSSEECLPGGPPCLNHLCAMGFPNGTRNNGIFNLGVYAKKAYGDDWRKYIQEYNGKYMQPPLEASEIQGIIKSIEKKDFTYTCKQAPIANYCNMPKCRGCKHGIGMGNLGLPKFGTLTKVMTKPPIWFLDVEGGGRLELTTDDLQSARNFQNRCMENLNMMPLVPKAEVWNEMISTLLQDVHEVEVPQEATPAGQLWQHLEDFTTSRVQGRMAEDLLLGKPWLHDDMYFFRMRDFLAYLERQKFKLLQLNHISMMFHEWKLEKRFWNVGGKGVNTYGVSSSKVKKVVGSLTPVEIPNPERNIT